METGYKLDADSIRLIDKVVRQVMASEPTTRGRSRRSTGAASPIIGMLVVTIEDIPAADIMPWSELDARARGGFSAVGGSPPSSQSVWSPGAGMVAPAAISLEEFSTFTPPQNEGNSPPKKVTRGPFITGRVDGAGEPYEIKAYNMVPEVIHRGKLCQAKQIQIDDTTLLFIDVEPCD